MAPNNKKEPISVTKLYFEYKNDFKDRILKVFKDENFSKY